MTGPTHIQEEGDYDGAGIRECILEFCLTQALTLLFSLQLNEAMYVLLKSWTASISPKSKITVACKHIAVVTCRDGWTSTQRLVQNDEEGCIGQVAGEAV